MENGKPLKTMIRRADLTQMQVAAELGIHASALSMIIAGYAKLKPELVPKLAVMLHVPQKKITDAVQVG